MSIRIAIHHKTHYSFDRPVSVSPHVLRLRPAAHSRTAITAYSLVVEPAEHFINWQQDPYGNYEARLVFTEETRSLSFEVELLADMTAYNPFDFFVESYAENYPFKYDPQLKKALAPYLEKTEQSKALRKWIKDVPKGPLTINDLLVLLNQRLQQDIEYSLRFEPGVQTPTQTLKRGIGSCRDTAWLFVQILRHLGLAARFVSGYLVQLAPDVKSLDGPSGPESDFTDLHAWCEVFLPGAGWVGLDATSGLFASEGHIPLACTPEPLAAAPVSGAIGPCEVTFSYSNEVFRVHEDPRVTKPYTDDQWQSIDALGLKIDREFAQNDVRLTMGGEPTFISVDDMESAQWNTAALGEEKLKLAKDLLIRLKDRFSPGGLLHYGQGKWYPGEEVPRWALGCFWRNDEQPLWHDPALQARVDKDYGHAAADAKRFMKRLVKQLGIDGDYVNPAYENALYYVWLEESLPVGIDPYSAELKDGLERRRLAQVLKQGLNEPCGYVLPLAWDFQREHWSSTPWELKAGRVILIPGDSPMGLRLPLDSLPPETEEDVLIERDPFDPREQLRMPVAPGDGAPMPAVVQGQREKARAVGSDKKPDTKPELKKVSRSVIRTSLCIEARGGTLHIFMPPMEHLEHYVALINAIEHTAELLKKPVVIEGYEPPRDPRLRKLLVTPDPGVIEVNIHPSANWSDLRDITTQLYEEAHLSRLTTEKFMQDGRHTGTGGGNHVTLGGATPADSPLLRRPDLLQSLVTYWQHHPGLSYLFSGVFIGPTSQAPRVDEGRDEKLYELEIAFSQIPQGEVPQPWLVDRLMRNLLVDVTGNTHRSEFCIDKLYSPGGASGRQGILEFRGFEMPPHSQMALVQVLLLRSLVAMFWHQPYRQPLVRWGTRLHDQFMMPHFVWSDIKDVVRDLNEAGFPFQLDWLAPFEEFRFPHYGRSQIDDMTLEIRWAIEPWHVLGEEISSFGTSRYVDSSVERLQVKISGATGNRHVVACNGRRVPMHPTSVAGEFVGAVRYKAWQPPSGLHPQISPHSPLVFDVIDQWNGRAIGGCTYHVSHAGGRSYDTFPVNAMEAEARRTNRFWEFGHTPGGLEPPSSLELIREFFPNSDVPRPMQPPAEENTGEYPMTLDLRTPAN